VGLGDFVTGIVHPQRKERDRLIASATEDPATKTVHWGKQEFSAAEYQTFKANMQSFDFSKEQIAVLRAVHDGKPVPGTAEHVSPNHVTAEQLMAKATYDKEGNLHIDKLTVDKGVAGDFKKVMLQGRPVDPELAAMVQEASKKGIHVRQDEGANSRAEWNGTVYWDSKHLTTDYYNESNLSTGRTFKHEMSHALRDGDTKRVLQGIPDGRYSNREEQAAIECEHRYMDPRQMPRDSHIANSVRTVDDPNTAPQVCANPEIGVSVSELKDGKPGPSVYKSSGQLKGKVDGITIDHDKESGNDYRVVHLTDDRGKKLDIRFMANLKDIEAEGGSHPHPMTSLTWNVRNGDEVTIKFDPRHGNATLEDKTQNFERVSDPYGKVTERQVDFAQQRQEQLSTHHR